MRARHPLPSLPRHAWCVLGGDAVSALGSGLTLPYLVVYLHEVRGLEIGVAALAASTIAATGLVGNPLGGWLADRRGAHRALAAGLALAALGSVALAGATQPWSAFAATGLIGLGRGIAWPAVSALLGGLVAPAQRSALFSVRFALMNAGFAVGGLLAAAVVDLDRPATFELVYLLDGACTLAFAAGLLGLRMPAQEVAPRDTGGYRAVLRDRRFLRVWLLMAALVTIGYAQLNTAFPAFAVDGAGATAGQLGLAFAANTVTVVVAQIFVLCLLEGRRRTRCVTALCACWATTWILTLVAGGLDGAGGALAALVGAMVIFALGETLLAPTLTPMVNDLAPDALRGRYNGAFTVAWSAGYLAGPALSGAAMAAGAAEGLLAGLALACVLTGAHAWRMERHLPAAANFVGGSPRQRRTGARLAEATS